MESGATQKQTHAEVDLFFSALSATVMVWFETQHAIKVGNIGDIMHVD